MIIFDQKSAKRKNKEHLWFIYDHLWPKKARSAKTKNIYVSFIVIFD